MRVSDIKAGLVGLSVTLLANGLWLATGSVDLALVGGALYVLLIMTRLVRNWENRVPTAGLAAAPTRERPVTYRDPAAPPAPTPPRVEPPVVVKRGPDWASARFEETCDKCQSVFRYTEQNVDPREYAAYYPLGSVHCPICDNRIEHDRDNAIGGVS